VVQSATELGGGADADALTVIDAVAVLDGSALLAATTWYVPAVEGAV
jgi:hypothetical protein